MRRTLGLAAAAVALAWPDVGAARERHRTFSDFLTPLTDPTDDWRERRTFTGQPIIFYGQVDVGALAYDDGVSTRGYVPVSNSNSASRLGFFWHLRPILGVKSVFRMEIGLTPAATNTISQINPDGGGWSLDSANIRRSELIFDHPRRGTMMIGQGSMATDQIAQIDLSRTKVAAYSNVGQAAGGMLFRTRAGLLSTVNVGEVFANYDGNLFTGYTSDGSRKVRIRYDTPDWHGFTLAVAYGTGIADSAGNANADAALRFDRKIDGYRIGAGIGISNKNSSRTVSGSFSVVHQASGMTITGAAGSNRDAGAYGYLKLGMIRKLFDWGDTAFSVDYYYGNDIFGTDSVSRSVGLALTQSIERRNIEFFALLRRYSYDEPAVDFRPSTALLSGVMWKF